MIRTTVQSVWCASASYWRCKSVRWWRRGWEVRIHSARRRGANRLAATLAVRRNNNNPVVSVPHQIAIARNKSFLAVENLFVALETSN